MAERAQSLDNVVLEKVEIQSVHGKGKGLIASTDIPTGERILCETPLFTVRNLPPPLLERAILPKLKSLSKAQQRQFLSLHNNFPGKHPFSGIAKTNALPCGSGSATGGVYPTICLINHSCFPNAHNNWNSENEHETIHAIRPIKAGEEITISYDKGGTYSTRQAFLKDAFGFDCRCETCTLTTPERKASDARRESMQRLDDAIGDPFRMQSDPAASLADCQSLLKILEEEFHGYPGAYIARLYYDAFQITVAHSDKARAIVFAERAAQARIVCEGEDSPDTRKMRSFAQKPTSHANFGGYSKKWRSSETFVPRNLSAADFETWLWRFTR